MLEYLQAFSPKNSLVKIALICANYVLGQKEIVLGGFGGFVNKQSWSE